MPKKTAHPRLRVHVRKGKGGQVWSSWYYDRRPDGLPDEPLGNDYAEAVKKWDELHNLKPRIAGTLREAFDRWIKEVLPTYESEETRKGYGRNAKTIMAWCGPKTWDAIEVADLKMYLKKRTAKTQGNREMAVMQIVWNWARTERLTKLPWPAHGMEKSKWRNKEHPRQLEVSDAVFAAVYLAASPMLKDAMDIATATGLRLTDLRQVLMPTNGLLHIRASKTGKSASYEIASSPVLQRVVETRLTTKATHLMLLSTPSGHPVSARMLRERWEEARQKAMTNPDNAAIAADIKAMYMRDLRKRAAALAEDMEAASKLLQHSSKAVTEKHYRRGDKLRPVR